MAFLQKILSSFQDPRKGKKTVHVLANTDTDTDTRDSEVNQVVNPARPKGRIERAEDDVNARDQERMSRLDFSRINSSSSSTSGKDLYDIIQFDDINVDLKSTSDGGRKRKSMPPKTKKISSARSTENTENMNPNAKRDMDEDGQDEDNNNVRIKIKGQQTNPSVPSSSYSSSSLSHTVSSISASISKPSSNCRGNVANGNVKGVGLQVQDQEKDCRFESSRPVATKRSFSRPNVSNLVVLGLHGQSMPEKGAFSEKGLSNPFLPMGYDSSSLGIAGLRRIHQPNQGKSIPVQPVPIADSNTYDSSTYDSNTYDGGEYSYHEGCGDQYYPGGSLGGAPVDRTTGAFNDDDVTVASESCSLAYDHDYYKQSNSTKQVRFNQHQQEHYQEQHHFYNGPEVKDDEEEEEDVEDKFELIEKAFSKIRHKRANEFKSMISSGHVHIDDVDSKGNNALHLCAQNNSKKLAAFCINNNCAKNLLNHKGQSPLDYAVIYQFYELAAYLKENKCYSSSQINFKVPISAHNPIDESDGYARRTNNSRGSNSTNHDVSSYDDDAWEGQVIE